MLSWSYLCTYSWSFILFFVFQELSLFALKRSMELRNSSSQITSSLISAHMVEYALVDALSHFKRYHITWIIFIIFLMISFLLAGTKNALKNPWYSCISLRTLRGAHMCSHFQLCSGLVGRRLKQ